MRVGVGGMRVVQVVGGDHRQVEVAAQAQQPVADPGLDVEPVVHQLEVEVAGTEDVNEFGGAGPGLLVVADPKPGLDLAGRAAGRGDQAAGVLRQQLAVGARLVEEAFERRARREPEQVVHSSGVLGEQRHVSERATAGDVVLSPVRPAHPGPVVAGGIRGEVGLHADDRFDARGRGLLVEVVGTEDVAVVGHRQGRHAHALDLGEQFGQPRGAVEHRVLGMDVQMHERVGCP